MKHVISFCLAALVSVPLHADVASAPVASHSLSMAQRITTMTRAAFAYAKHHKTVLCLGASLMLVYGVARVLLPKPLDVGAPTNFKNETPVICGVNSEDVQRALEERERRFASYERPKEQQESPSGHSPLDSR